MPDQRTYLFVGGCTRPTPYYPSNNAKGVSTFLFNEEAGTATPVGVIEGIDNPTWIDVDPQHGALHAVSEVFGWNEGLVSAYAIDPATGNLKYLNKQPTLGSIAAHSSRDRTGKFLFVANYSLTAESELPNKAVAVLPIREDGGLEPAADSVVHSGTGVIPDRQSRPHPHAALATPDNRYVVVADLGLDLLVVYRFDSQTGALTRAGATSMEPGSGPRHLVFHPRGHLAYVVNEINSTVSSFTFEAEQARFTHIATLSTLPEGASGENHCSEIVISGNGSHLYVGNRGHDSIAIFALDGDGGMRFHDATPCGGQIPRFFALDPSGNFMVVANQNSGKLSVFSVNRDSGELTATGAEIETGTPTCVAFHRVDIE